jgi:multiple sugar transport system ATP-binding protein
MATVRFDHAQRRFPGETSTAVDDLNLSIEDGELMVLVGPSGSGKSTSLRMLAGLEDVTSGSIWIGDRDVTRLAPRERDIAMVFQNYALYPHMSVADNIAFPLKRAKVPAEERRRRVLEAARMLELEPLLGRKPEALSGGQRQRVAMGRSIVRRPRVFLMDEPLSNLDAQLRVTTRTQIADLQQRLNVTTVYVTHDQTEAMTLGDRVAVMKDGLLQQVDTPLNLYDRPGNVFVAGFIGSPAMNLFDGKIADGHVHIGSLVLPVSPVVAAGATGDVTVGVRSEAWSVVAADQPGISIIVDFIEELGSDSFSYGTTDTHGAPQQVVLHSKGERTHHKGEGLRLSVTAAQLHLFDVSTGVRLGTA